MPDIPTFDSLQTPASALADAFEREAMLHAGDAWGNVYIASATCIRALLNALDLSTLRRNELFRENATLKTAADRRKENEEYEERAAARHEALVRDASRYRWLRQHYAGANFEPNDHDGMDLIFAVPQGVVSGNCDMTVDASMKGANAELSGGGTPSA